MIVIHMPSQWDWLLRDNGYVVRMLHHSKPTFEVFSGRQRVGTVQEGVMHVVYPNALEKANQVLAILEGAG